MKRQVLIECFPGIRHHLWDRTPEHSPFTSGRIFFPGITEHSWTNGCRKKRDWSKEIEGYWDTCLGPAHLKHRWRQTEHTLGTFLAGIILTSSLHSGLPLVMAGGRRKLAPPWQTRPHPLRYQLTVQNISRWTVSYCIFLIFTFITDSVNPQHLKEIGFKTLQICNCLKAPCSLNQCALIRTDLESVLCSTGLVKHCRGLGVIGIYKTAQTNEEKGGLRSC